MTAGMWRGLTANDRFDVAVDRTPDCWLWNGHRTQRYGTLKVCGKETLAHRFAYERYVGEIPEGLELDHLCRNTFCVNPEHLEPVTHRENMRRSANANTTHCKAGLHPWTADNIYVDPRGRTCCRPCASQRSRAYRQRAVAS